MSVPGTVSGVVKSAPRKSVGPAHRGRSFYSQSAELLGGLCQEQDLVENPEDMPTEGLVASV